MRLSVLSRRLILLLAMAACGGSPAVVPMQEVCTGFGDWAASPYVLPYPMGAAYPVIQGNCSPPGNGHTGVTRYGYDFGMPIGSTLVAARAGVVLHVVESHRDGEVGPTGLDNYVVIGQSDGTTALYGHLTFEGSFVVPGETVVQGQRLGLSGNTGNTSNVPHLHFSVASCDTVTLGTAACPTLPVNFRNTEPNPNGLDNGRSYRAL